MWFVPSRKIYTPMACQQELDMGLNPTNASDADLDGDNDCLPNVEEFLAGLSAVTNDTDGDTMWDGWEWTYATNNLLHTL